LNDQSHLFVTGPVVDLARLVARVVQPPPLRRWYPNCRPPRLAQEGAAERNAVEEMLSAVGDLVATGEGAGADFGLDEWTDAERVSLRSE
jgi:hypothetical protein